MKRTASLILLALSACATSGAAQGPASQSNLPEFTLNSVDGEQVRLSDYLGKQVVVLSFWATWCQPCQTELPHLQEIYARHKDQGMVVLAVDMDDPSTLSQVAPLVRRQGFTFPVLLDTETKAANLYNRQKNAPYTVVIDRAGKIHSEKAGYEPGSEKVLEDEVTALLAVPAAP